jgi:arginyl-tRNA synthetase
MRYKVTLLLLLLLFRSMRNCEPVGFVGYLFDLARAINHAFVHLKVKDTEQHLAEARMLMFESARVVLNNGMKLLGLVPVERM